MPRTIDDHAQNDSKDELAMKELGAEEEAASRDIVTDLPTPLSFPLVHRRSMARDPEPKYDDPDPRHAPPPSFAQSEFETIVRRQRNNQPHMLKIPNIPSRFPNLNNSWEFAGWGSMSYVELTPEDLSTAEATCKHQGVQLDALRASSIAGNAMYGSVFYAFPAVAAIAGILSPISLLIACLILFFFRPILLELTSAMRFNGAIYAYCLQCSGKTMALVAVSAMFLDGVATASVSAATVSAYLSGELNGALSGMKEAAVAIGILVLGAAAGLLNLKESSGVTLTFNAIHLTTMAMLIIASIVAWAREGTGIIRANWELRPQGTAELLKSVFYGTCLSFLGVTGIETMPTYIEHIRLGSFKTTINTCLYTVLSLNAPLMLCVYAILPSDTILNGGNVLSHLAEAVAGRWLRIIVVVDCVLVLGGGGVLAGLVSMCAMIQKLAKDRVIPSFFLNTLRTGSTHWAVAFFLFLAIVLYASSGFQLATISSVFSVAFLGVMSLYAFSNVLLKFNRDRLPRKYRTGLGVTTLAFLLIIVVLVGNVVQSPKIIGLFLAYFVAILACLLGLKERIELARLVMWLYDQNHLLQKWKHTRGWDASIVRWMSRLRTTPICVWVKSDDIYNLLEAILYVRKNELTARVIFLHAYENALDIPSELEANAKILDEAFPSITIDLIFLKGRFNPVLVEAASAKLKVPKSQMFMSTIGTEHCYSLADYGGVRVANL